MKKIIGLITPFGQVFTKNGFGHFKTIIVGFIILQGFFSIERIGNLFDKGPKTIREWLSKTKLNMSELTQSMVNMLEERVRYPLVHGCLPIAIDDTKTNKKYGKKMEQRTAIYSETVEISTPKGKQSGKKEQKASMLIHGHCWVTLGLMLFNKTFPVWARGHLTEKLSKKENIRSYLTKPELALDMLEKIKWPNPLLLIGDIAYGCKTLLNSVHNVLSRIRSNGVVYELLSSEPSGKRGRPRKYGTKHKLGEWWDEVTKQVISVNGESYEFYTEIVLLKYCDRRVRLIMAKGKKDKKPWYLFTTLTDMEPCEMIEWYRYRWGIEVSFKDLKGLMGMEHYHLRKWSSIQHYVQFSIIAYSLLKLWVELYHSDFSTEQAKLALKQDFIGSRIFMLVSHFLKTDDNSYQLDAIKRLIV